MKVKALGHCYKTAISWIIACFFCLISHLGNFKQSYKPMKKNPMKFKSKVLVLVCTN